MSEDKTATEAWFKHQSARPAPPDAELVFVSAGNGLAEIEWIELKAQIDLAYTNGKKVRLEIYR